MLLDAFVEGAVGVENYTASGLFYGGGINQLLVQLAGVVIVAAWVLITTGILFSVLKATMGLRVSEQEEREGLDVHEHGAPGYAPDVTVSV